MLALVDERPSFAAKWEKLEHWNRLKRESQEPGAQPPPLLTREIISIVSFLTSYLFPLILPNKSKKFKLTDPRGSKEIEVECRDRQSLVNV
jgi:hypothetical protein